MASMQLPATDKKLREARHFLEQMRVAATGVPVRAEEFEFALSAFLNAARNVTFAMQSEEKEKYDAWFPAWKARLFADESSLLDDMKRQRNADQKTGGAHTSSSIQYVPAAVRPSGHVDSAAGVSVVGIAGTLDVAVGRLVHEFNGRSGTRLVLPECQRYLALLERLTNDFRAAR